MAMMETATRGDEDELGGLLNFDALRAAQVFREPYSFLHAQNVLTDAQASDIRADYPGIATPGYHPLEKLDRHGAFDRLARDLESAELARALGELFGVDLSDKPRMITVRRLSQKSDGPIHNDSKRKILTMLTYLNETWDGTGAGCIRVLKSKKSFDDYVFEAPPLAGHVFAFLRSEESWHGHLPFEGERYVVQTTFLTSADALEKKRKSGALHLRLKSLNPFA